MKRHEINKLEAAEILGTADETFLEIFLRNTKQTQNFCVRFIRFFNRVNRFLEEIEKSKFFRS